MSDFPRHVQLPGGFHCDLTNDEQNEWNEFSFAHPAVVNYDRTVNAFDHGRFGTGVSLEEYCERYERYVVASHAMRSVAKEWYAGVLERREQAEGK